MKSSLTSDDLINWNETIAFSSDISGVNRYTFCGVIIKQDTLKERSYETIRNEIMNILYNLTNQSTGERLIKWIKKREELYNGEFIEKYPDIVFEFKEDYGAGWSLEDNIINPCDSHNIQSGCHRLDTSVFLISNSNSKMLVRQNITLMDIAPTILDILGIDEKIEFDGRSIFRM